MNSERAATEVLGYVLVIALVTILIAIVMTTGINGLENSQQAEQINNMERGFDVLSHNIEALITDNGPHRSTELRLSDGSIQFGERTQLNVTVDGSLIDNQTVITYPIEFRDGSGTNIAYEGGSVIREEDRALMLQEPPIIATENHLIVHGVRTRSAANAPESIQRSGTIQIRKEHVRTNWVRSTTSAPVNVSVTSEREEAWRAYFEALPRFDEVESPAGTVKYQYDFEDEGNVTFVESIIRVELSD